MKKLIYIIATGLLFTAISCGGNSQSETSAAVDSDSIIAAQQAEKAALAEQMRLDSIRQDSIRQDSIKRANKFANSLPNPKTLFSKYYETERGRYLKGLGFTGSTKNNDGACFEQYSKGNYILKGSNGESCKITWEAASCGRVDEIKVTITGDDSAFNDFFIKANKTLTSDREWDINVTRKGNTVNISAERVQI